MNTPTVVCAACLLAAPLLADDPFVTLPAHLQPLVDSGDISGAVLLVADADHILHLSAVGFRSAETRQPMQVDDLFAVASMTKPVTAVAIAILADEGRLSFDDPVQKHLPEFNDAWMVIEETRDPPKRVLAPVTRPITLRDLLTHTSGMRDVPTLDAHWTLSEKAKLISQAPLAAPPGTRWAYCSSSFDVLGRVVEVASGQSFAGFVGQRICQPLQMTDTAFRLTAAQAARLAAGYQFDGTTKRLRPFVPPPWFGAPTDTTASPRPAGGLFSTATDMAHFYQMLLHGGTWGDRRILKESTVAELLRPQTGHLPGNWPGFAWGLGIAVLQEPSSVHTFRSYSPGSFGHGGAAGTISFADRSRGLIRVLMVHVVGLPEPLNSPARRAFEDGVVEALGSG